MTPDQRTKLEQMAASYPDGVANATLKELTAVTRQRDLLMRVFLMADDLRANYFEHGDANAHDFWLEQLDEAVQNYKAAMAKDTAS